MKKIRTLFSVSFLASTFLLPLSLISTADGTVQSKESYYDRLTSNEKKVFDQVVVELGMSLEQQRNALAYKFGDMFLIQDRSIFGVARGFFRLLEKTVGKVSYSDLNNRLFEWFIKANQESGQAKVLTTTEVVGWTEISRQAATLKLLEIIYKEPAELLYFSA